MVERLGSGGDPQKESHLDYYTYYSPDHVGVVLGEYGYTRAVQFVHGLYVLENTGEEVYKEGFSRPHAVRVTNITENMCVPHFGEPIMLGAHQTEVMAQTLLLYLRFTSRVDENSAPRFKTIEHFDFRLPIVPGVTVNTPIRHLADGGYRASGKIACGSLLLAKGIVEGNFMDREKAGEMLERVKSLELRQKPEFPFR
jgi:hypothetical protein